MKTINKFLLAAALAMVIYSCGPKSAEGEEAISAGKSSKEKIMKTVKLTKEEF